MRACEGSSSPPSCRRRTIGVEVSARSHSSLPRRSRGEGQISGVPNLIKMIFITSSNILLLMKILTSIIIIIMRKRTNLMYPVVMRKRKQKIEGRESVKRRRRVSRKRKRK